MEGIGFQVVHAQLRRALSAVWRRGWQPADVVRYTGRHQNLPDEALMRDAIADEISQYAPATVDPRWHAQLETMGARVWWPVNRTLLQAWAERDGWQAASMRAQELLIMLPLLPAIEVLGAVPGEYRGPVPGASGTSGDGPRPDVDEKILARIRAMLAKAESTTSEAEAEAFTAGAQERMARYSIDRAMLEATYPDRPRIPAGRRIGLENPYETAKVMLLFAVVSANRCRGVYSKSLGFCTIVGFETDLVAVETLYTSLLVQAFSAMTRAGASASRGARSRSRGFRHSFLVAYADRIGERLAEIAAEQTEAAQAEPGGSDLVPVLAAREQAVDDTTAQMFPKTQRWRVSQPSDGYGWSSGRTAADLATIEARSGVRG